MCSKGKNNKSLLVLFIAFSLIILSVPAFSATLSIGTDDQVYIQIEEGGPLYPIADFISGAAGDGMTPAQRAAFVVEVAAEQVRNASSLSPQAKYDAALAAQLAAEEAVRQTTDSEVIAQANSVIAAALSAQQDAIDAGATPGGFYVPPVTPEPGDGDMEPASPV